MSEDEIKLTTKNNETSKGKKFPETPGPQILKENFSSFEELDDCQNGFTGHGNDVYNKNK